MRSQALQVANVRLQRASASLVGCDQDTGRRGFVALQSPELIGSQRARSSVPPALAEGTDAVHLEFDHHGRGRAFNSSSYDTGALDGSWNIAKAGFSHQSIVASLRCATHRHPDAGEPAVRPIISARFAVYAASPIRARSRSICRSRAAPAPRCQSSCSQPARLTWRLDYAVPPNYGDLGGPSDGADVITAVPRQSRKRHAGSERAWACTYLPGTDHGWSHQARGLEPGSV